MSASANHIAIVTNVIPSYRLDFYRSLIAIYGKRLSIFCQAGIPGMDLYLVHDRLGQNVHMVKHATAKNETIGWQALPLRRLLQYDIVFFYGNPRILSNVVFSLLLRLLGRRVVIWGQVHTAGSNKFLKKLRLAWWRLFKDCFVYTDKERIFLEQNGFHRHTVIGMNNGMDQKQIDRIRDNWPGHKLASWRQENNLQGRPLLLSCARLVSKNRFEECIDLLVQLERDDSDALWIVIGDGPERKRLQRLAAEKEVQDNVLWLGAIYSEEPLAPWFLSADLFLHPSGIGLSLLHAMGYGLPVITQGDNRFQMPEFAAFENGETGFIYEAGNPADFHRKVRALLSDDGRRRRMGRNAEQIARTHYNKDVMVERFNQMVGKASRRGIV
jgi:glycosyltransferase involved in cell wall biosynthesis